ncbi:hypothetical protein LguiA_028205 [Lonicera macranthoides]
MLMAPSRGRPASSISKSTSVLNISGKDKSAKPPRRLSIPTKSNANPAPKPVGNITPISEKRAKRSASSQGKGETPISDVSRSSLRRKFSVLSSASYWLSQIKLTESAAKHSISLGFFKLALEAGCEPLQRMRDELKSYTRRHSLVELGDQAKELFESYNILENFEQLHVSETCSQVPEEGTRSSDEDVHSSYSIMGTQSLNTYGGSPANESTKGTTWRVNHPVKRAKGMVNKNCVNSTSASQAGACKSQKKSQMSNKQEPNKVDCKARQQGKKSAQKEGPTNTSPTENALEENKENMGSTKV